MHDITGRDGYIVAKALAYAIAFIDSLPEVKQELSDRDDMVAMLFDVCRSDVGRERLAQLVERKTGILPDLTDWKAPER